MSWFFFALLSYFLAACALILDKVILTRAIPKGALYAAYAGIFSVYGLLLVPFGFSPSSIPASVFLLSLLSGFIFIIGLVFFYQAEQLDEILRVGPLTGAMSAIFTLSLSNVFSFEKLDSLDLFAFSFLILGAFLLSFRRSRISHFLKVASFSVLASVLFAISLILIKSAFLKTSFLNAYILGRFGEFFAGLFLFALPNIRKGIFSHLKEIEIKSVSLFAANKIVSALFFILFNYAVFLASASAVQALIGVQYVFLMGLVVLLSLKFPSILDEVSGDSIFKKTAAIFLIVLGLFILYASQDKSLFPGVQSYGATFSYSWAEKLGLNPKETYLAVLDDLKIRDLRIPLYWDDIEKEPSKYDFENIDWQVKEAEKREAKIIMAIGYKLPRWPECHIPLWLAPEEKSEFKKSLLVYIAKSALRYKDSPSVWAWQVENEPFLKFGECPELDRGLLDEEINLVRDLTGRPVIATDSGELSFWVQAAKKSDIFGTTMYRTVWDRRIPFGGYFKYPLPAAFFRLKANLAKLFTPIKKIIVIELQTEPWGPKQLYESSLDEQFYYFDFEQFKENTAYARKTGFPEVYFWGVEWWHWLKEKQNHPEFWDYAKSVLNS